MDDDQQLAADRSRRRRKHLSTTALPLLAGLRAAKVAADGSEARGQRIGLSKDRGNVRPAHRRRNRGGNGGARPRNAETAGAKVSFRPRNNLPSLSAG